jgi:hypothetical protein
MKRDLFLILSFIICVNVNAQWIKQNSNVLGAGKEIMDFSIVSENVVWAPVLEYSGNYPVANQEFVKTTNGGDLWSHYTISNANNQGFSNIYAIDENIAWASMYSFNGGGYIYKTIDGGTSWKVTDSSMYKNGFPDLVYFFNSNDGVCVGDPNGGYYEIYTTNNGGAKWNRVLQSNIPNPLLNEGGISNIYSAVHDTIWFGTVKGRLFKSCDKGYTWSVKSLCKENTLINAIAFKDGYNGLVVPGSWDSLMYISKDNFGLQNVNYGSYGSRLKFVKSDGVHPSAYISGGYDHNICSISKDDGLNWITIDTLSHSSFGFINSSIGWTGACKKNENSADIYKYDPNYLIPNNVKVIKSTNCGVLIFPIPANELVNIKSDNIFNEVDVFSLDGKLLMNNKTTTKQLELNVSNLENGIYLIKVKSQSIDYSQRIIVKR